MNEEYEKIVLLLVAVIEKDAHAGYVARQIDDMIQNYYASDRETPYQLQSGVKDNIDTIYQVFEHLVKLKNR